MTPTASTTRASLRKESTADICALLKNYLDALPEPLLDDNLVGALHRLCVQPTLERAAAGEDTDADGDSPMGAPDSTPYPEDYFSSRAPPSPPTHGSGRARSAPPFPLPPGLLLTPSERARAALSAEAAQIAAAQHVLRLAPPPHGALLAYLLAFFTQLPLSPDNGLALEDVARLFGRALAGRASVTRDAVLMWLLERWGRVSDGLFDVAAGEDACAEDEREAAGPPFARAVPTLPALDVRRADLTPRQEAYVPAGLFEPAYFAAHRRQSTSASSDGSDSTGTGESESVVQTPFRLEHPLPAAGGDAGDEWRGGQFLASSPERHSFSRFPSGVRNEGSFAAGEWYLPSTSPALLIRAGIIDAGDFEYSRSTFFTFRDKTDSSSQNTPSPGEFFCARMSPVP